MKGISACREIVRHSFSKRKSAGMFQAAEQKEITISQQEQRQDYCNTHLFKPILGFWDGVQFTDEAHCALDDFPDE
jgi:hypothetical protein